MEAASDICSPEHRSFPRYPCTGAAEIFRSGKSWGWGTVSDISRRGCYIETMHTLPTNTEAQLRLTIAGILLDINANVVSTDEMFGMKMDFVDVPTEQWNKLPVMTDKSFSPALLPSAPNHEVHDHFQAGLRHLQQSQRGFQEAHIGQGSRVSQWIEDTINEIKRRLCEGVEL